MDKLLPERGTWVLLPTEAMLSHHPGAAHWQEMDIFLSLEDYSFPRVGGFLQFFYRENIHGGHGSSYCPWTLMEDILVGSRSLSSFLSSRKLVSKRNPRLCLVPVFFNLTVDLIGLFFRLSVSFFFVASNPKF